MRLSGSAKTAACPARPFGGFWWLRSMPGPSSLSLLSDLLPKRLSASALFSRTILTSVYHGKRLKNVTVLNAGSTLLLAPVARSPLRERCDSNYGRNQWFRTLITLLLNAAIGPNGDTTIYVARPLTCDIPSFRFSRALAGCLTNLIKVQKRPQLRQ